MEIIDKIDICRPIFNYMQDVHRVVLGPEDLDEIIRLSCEVVKKSNDIQNVICWVSHIEGLTYEEEYRVLLELNGMYVVEDDLGHLQTVGVDYFSPYI